MNKLKMDNMVNRLDHRQLICSIIVLVMVLAANPATAKVCDCPGFIAQIPDFDSAVFLTDPGKEDAKALHLPWGVPVNSAGATNESLIVQRHYILNYDADLNTPTWAAYRLTKEDVDETQPGFIKRKDCFRNYPQTLHPDNTPPLCSDYDNDSYDRGHLVNSNDMRRSRTVNANTFFLTNMAPQFPNFNQKIWRTLEGWVNRWAALKTEIYVITGAVFDSGPNSFPDGNRDPDDKTKRNDSDGRIAVASAFYKIILHKQANGKIETLSILLPHLNRSYTGKAREPYLRANITTIEEIEGLTGIQFLPKLVNDDPLEAAKIKKFKATKLWAIN